jgi:phenylacetate-CoA ligase
MSLLKYLQGNSPFYKGKLSSSGVCYQDIKTLDDLTKLPFTSKRDIIHAAERREYHAENCFVATLKRS